MTTDSGSCGRGRSRSRAMPLALAVGLLLAAAGCDEDAPLDPLHGSDGAVVTETEVPDRDLREVLEVRPADPSPGDTLVLRSTVVYEGPEPARLESRLCGLDLRAEDFELTPVLACEGYSRARLVSPGDTFRQEERAVVGGDPGRHALESRHLLDPDVWSRLELDVR